MVTATSRSGGVRARKGVAAFAAAVAIAAPAIVTVVTAAPAAAALVDNPFVGATQYINPDWQATVEASATQVAGSDPALAAKMRAIKNSPTSVWMDRIAAINGTDRQHGLEWHLDQALAQKQGSTPLVFNIVIYDLPGRDCFALASNGELPPTAAGMQRYKTEYIDPIAALLNQPEYEGIRFVATIEPDSLPNMVTNMSDPDCSVSAPYYREGVQYALTKLYEVGNVYSYIDAAHAGWLGWDDNATKAATEFESVIEGSTYGWNAVSGFVTNTANSTPLVEPFLTDPGLQIGGSFTRQAKWFEWNPNFDESDWTARLHSLMVSKGAPASLGMLIDTSRNGWGGSARPTAVSTSTNIDTYVDQSRVDRRTHRGAWCNPSGAGIGERPTVAPSGYTASHLDAFVWVKPPGESDGSSTEIPNDEGKRLDRMCDPTYSTSVLGGNLTGALPGAPLSGHWFHNQFAMLVQNAYPVIGGGTGGDTQAPSVPSGLTAGTVTSSSVALSWTASTDNVGVTGYDVVNAAGTVVATSTSASATVSGLTPSTAYQFRVRAKDAAGNTSGFSTAVSATTTAGAGDTQAPTVPSGLTAGAVTASSVALTWVASTDNVGVTGYDVVNAAGTVVATSTSTSATVSGLTANTAYQFRVRAKDAAGNVSAFSAAVSATTSGGTTGDTQAPTVPSGLTAGTVTSSSVALSWAASTDNVGVTGYDVVNAAGAVVATSTSTSATVSGLTANTAYQFRVRAKDAAGNLSAFSAAVTATTSGGTTNPGTCSASLRIVNSWQGGYQAEVTVTAGTSAITRWTVALGTTPSQIWSATLSGQNASNAAWNGSLGAGASTTFGFIGSGTVPAAGSRTCS
ncbi:glycoside hydrolase family 6 protein [Antribacter gilvus]|uniref:glycoside hydrolase family 6 protein n=1 Tax=Antribacter gilvus TaxID=2304675 RepID=UPI000F7B8206|nr:glycoside hydrolase family 6 protein [Antribacter gilvus]